MMKTRYTVRRGERARLICGYCPHAVAFSVEDAVKRVFSAQALIEELTLYLFAAHRGDADGAGDCASGSIGAS
jgi:hypothetical protein